MEVEYILQRSAGVVGVNAVLTVVVALAYHLEIADLELADDDENRSGHGMIVEGIFYNVCITFQTQRKRGGLRELLYSHGATPHHHCVCSATIRNDSRRCIRCALQYHSPHLCLFRSGKKTECNRQTTISPGCASTLLQHLYIDRHYLPGAR